MIVRALLVLLGLFHIANGLFMLILPMDWYATVPGVPLAGPFNGHFILDIGMAFLASGTGLMLGARAGRGAALLACAGATWPALHALIHVEGWAMHGLPHEAHIAASEIGGVFLIALLGVVLAWMRVRGEKS